MWLKCHGALLPPWYRAPHNITPFGVDSLKSIFAAASLALLSTSAFAADAVFSSDAVPTAVSGVPAYNWGGAYVGLNAGYGVGRATGYDTFFSEPDSNSVANLDAQGFFGGFQAGYQWQVGSFVYGVETDLQLSGIGIDEIDEAADVEWFGSTRARIGYLPNERLLAYVTGGVAYGRLSYDVYELPELGGAKTTAGWTLGAGIEYALDSQWSLKTEYLYTDLGKFTFWEDDYERHALSYDFHAIRVGVNYKF